MPKTNLVGETLSAILEQGADYGRGDNGAGKTVVIDFSHPKLPAIWHSPSAVTVIGNALRNIYRALGYEVVGVNHLGDWGSQFAKLILAWNYWGEGELTADITFRSCWNSMFALTKRLKTIPNSNQEARDWFRRLEDGMKKPCGCGRCAWM